MMWNTILENVVISLELASKFKVEMTPNKSFTTSLLRLLSTNVHPFLEVTMPLAMAVSNLKMMRAPTRQCMQKKTRTLTFKKINYINKIHKSDP